MALGIILALVINQKSRFRFIKTVPKSRAPAGGALSLDLHRSSHFHRCPRAHLCEPRFCTTLSSPALLYQNHPSFSHKPVLHPLNPSHPMRNHHLKISELKTRRSRKFTTNHSSSPLFSIRIAPTCHGHRLFDIRFFALSRTDHTFRSHLLAILGHSRAAVPELQSLQRHLNRTLGYFLRPQKDGIAFVGRLLTVSVVSWHLKDHWLLNGLYHLALWILYTRVTFIPSRRKTTSSQQIIRRHQYLPWPSFRNVVHLHYRWLHWLHPTLLL